MGAVERGVETGHLQGIGKRGQGGFDPGDIVRLVERRKRRQSPQLIKHRRVDHHRFGPACSAVHHAVSNGAYVRLGKPVQQKRQRGF